MLDLFSGTGGAGAAFREAGWEVVAVDNDPQHRPDVLADLTTWSWAGPRPDLVWASPPCTEFSRMGMPWTRKRGAPWPDLTLVGGALRIVGECRPRYWVLENVRGAVPYITPLVGRVRVVAGPFHLWGYFPPFRLDVPPFKERLSGTQRVARAAVPYALSAGLLRAIEAQQELPISTERRTV